MMNGLGGGTKTIDSYPKLSFYTPTGDSTHGSVVLQDNALLKYDSIGALP